MRSSTWGPRQYLDKVVDMPVGVSGKLVYPQLQLIDKVLAPRFDELRGGFLGPCTQVQGRPTTESANPPSESCHPGHPSPP